MRVEATGLPMIGGEVPLDMPIEEVEKLMEAEIESALSSIEQKCSTLFHEKSAGAFSEVTAPKYNAGVTVTRDGTAVEAVIDGWLPSALEIGCDKFDMKPGLLAGRQSRVIRLRNGNFRTVSTRSPANSWIHPGLIGKHFSEEVQDELQKFGDDLFTQIRSRVAV